MIDTLICVGLALASVAVGLVAWWLRELPPHGGGRLTEDVPCRTLQEPNEGDPNMEDAPNGLCDECGTPIADNPTGGARFCPADVEHDPYSDGFQNGGDPFDGAPRGDRRSDYLDAVWDAENEQ